MKEYGIGDGSTIRDIISEVDTDNVSIFSIGLLQFFIQVSY